MREEANLSMSCVSSCIRQHASAYVSIRQHTSADVSIRQHTSAYVSIRACEGRGEFVYVLREQLIGVAYIHSIRQHTPAHVSIRQHTPAYVSIRQHTFDRGCLFGCQGWPFYSK